MAGEIVGKSFNKQVLDYQIEWRRKHIPAEIPNGVQNGVQYSHILPSEKWELGLWGEIQRPLLDYVSVTSIQANRFKHNLKSSWTQCANLFFPFRWNSELRKIFADFLSEQFGLIVKMWI